jgi:hypothetical protein
MHRVEVVRKARNLAAEHAVRDREVGSLVAIEPNEGIEPKSQPGTAQGSRSGRCVPSFREGLEDPLHEGGQIVGCPTGHEVSVPNAGCVLPHSAGIFDIVADGKKPGRLPSLKALR